MLRRLAGVLLALGFAGRAAAAACDGPAHQALDFWLGAWVVKDGGKPVATSRIGRTARASSAA
jgi:hypothetical protein